MNASVGDVLNQGKLAIYVSNISEEGILLQGNNLWVPTGGSRAAADLREHGARDGRRPRRLELRRAVRRSQQRRLPRSLSRRTATSRPSRDESYWYDYSKVAGGHQIVIGDAANWPAMGTRSLAGYQPKRVWINDGSGRFVDVAQMVGATDRHDGRAVALADFGGRGALDVVVANQRGPLLLYKNRGRPGSPVDRASISKAAAGRTTPAADVQQPQRDRRAGRGVLERTAAGAGGVRRVGLLRPESAPAPLRPRHAGRPSIAW